MPGLSYQHDSCDGYRFGFNTQEKEPELNNGFTSAEFWMYDGRLGRRWNVDPIEVLSMGSYVCLENNPLLFCDPLGDIVKYGSWQDRVNTLFARIISANFRASFRAWQALGTNVTIRRSENGITKNTTLLDYGTGGTAVPQAFGSTRGNTWVEYEHPFRRDYVIANVQMVDDTRTSTTMTNIINTSAAAGGVVTKNWQINVSTNIPNNYRGLTTISISNNRYPNTLVNNFNTTWRFPGAAPTAGVGGGPAQQIGNPWPGPAGWIFADQTTLNIGVNGSSSVMYATTWNVNSRVNQLSYRGLRVTSSTVMNIVQVKVPVGIMGIRRWRQSYSNFTALGNVVVIPGVRTIQRNRDSL